MPFDQNWPKINDFKLSDVPLRTVQEAILGYNSLRKRIKSTKFVFLKINQNMEKVVSPWFFVKMNQIEIRPSKSANKLEKARWLAHAFCLKLAQNKCF